MLQIRLLRYFVAVAQEQGVTRAAQKLYISQPALSRQMAQLEQQLGAALFVRSPQRGRALALTPQGQRLYRRAQDILELVDTIPTDLAQLPGRRSNPQTNTNQQENIT